MLSPYLYAVTGKSKDVQRNAPNGARVAIHYPELGRTVELETDALSRYTLTDRPAPGVGGAAVVVVRGQLEPGQPGPYHVTDAETVREAAGFLRAFHGSNTNALASKLDAMAQRMTGQTA